MYDNKLEEYLSETGIGGIFGVGWKNQKAPRVVFYSYILMASILWVAFWSLVMYVCKDGLPNDWVNAVSFAIWIFSSSVLLIHIGMMFVKHRPDFFDSKWRSLFSLISLPLDLSQMVIFTIIVSVFETIVGRN